MDRRRVKPRHPGQVLEQDFLRRYGLTPSSLARHMKYDAADLTHLLRGRRRIGPKLAWLLADALGTDVMFWLEIQARWDAATAQPDSPAPRHPAIPEPRQGLPFTGPVTPRSRHGGTGADGTSGGHEQRRRRRDADSSSG